MPDPHRLSVVLSHPVQYYSPWLAMLHARHELELMVHYLWDYGVSARVDSGFGHAVQWDMPLLEGYPSEFVPNVSARPGTDHARGLDNPTIVERICAARPDAILFFGYAYASHLRALFAPRLWHVPKLLRGDSHDIARPAGLRSHAMRTLRRGVFSRFDACLAVGRANARYLKASGVPEDRIYFAPHCVDNTRFRGAASIAISEARQWRTSLQIPPDARVLLFAGKFEAKKRPLDLLEAFLGIDLSRRSGAVVLFVGAGALEPQLRARSAGHEDVVFFAPFQNQSLMPRVYASGDVLVLPSFGSGETWGLAVNEAMNLRRPVVVSSHVGCAEDLVVPGETGWVFPAGDVSALQSAIEQVVSIPEDLLRQMGERAQQRVECYSYAAAADAVVAAVEAVVTGRRSHS